MLIDAFARSFKGHENFSLLIAGSGPEYTALKNQISSLGVEEQVTLYGEATRLEVNNLLQASDCYVHPSRYETFGVALIEAMSCGLPIVSTKCGGPESIIVNSKLGILTPIDTDEMADAMLQVIRAHYDRDYIRQYAVDHFSNEAIVQKLEECYTSIIK